MEKTSMFQEFEEAFKNPGKEFRGTPFGPGIQNWMQIAWKSR